MAYKTIKSVLRHHIKTGVRSLWTWSNNNFTCIYDNYDVQERIYTPQQLLKILENVNDSNNTTTPDNSSVD
jgi:hypothetical protein